MTSFDQHAAIFEMIDWVAEPIVPHRFEAAPDKLLHKHFAEHTHLVRAQVCQEMMKDFLEVLLMTVLFVAIFLFNNERSHIDGLVYILDKVILHRATDWIVDDTNGSQMGLEGTGRLLLLHTTLEPIVQ